MLKFQLFFAKLQLITFGGGSANKSDWWARAIITEYGDVHTNRSTGGGRAKLAAVGVAVASLNTGVTLGVGVAVRAGGAPTKMPLRLLKL